MAYTWHFKEKMPCQFNTVNRSNPYLRFYLEMVTLISKIIDLLTFQELCIKEKNQSAVFNSKITSDQQFTGQIPSVLFS